MAEKDPALREKLWDEYRRYKASVSGSARESE
jgi:protein-S-isoprenylcysteine O-methyltransferase Ste14